ELTLDKPAQRVVVLEWTFTEDLIALGVQPVGNADNANYKVYVTPEAALDSNVVDVGTRNEPNLEAIASLKPDLIISNFDGNEA
ncbi:ABC transporter substrate-binding protein, partial [Paenibacillus sp. EKM205P]